MLLFIALPQVIFTKHSHSLVVEYLERCHWFWYHYETSSIFASPETSIGTLNDSLIVALVSDIEPWNTIDE